MSIHTVPGHFTSFDSVIEGLSQVLSATFVVTAKSQTYHWNVTGMAFGPLHALFQEIYENHFAAQDLIAERIKALGAHADGRLSTALKGTTIEECDGKISAAAMVERLSADQRALSAFLLRVARVAEENADPVTHDMLVERAEAHDKFAWMLEAHLCR